MNSIKLILLVVVLLWSHLFADDIDSLLINIEKRTDLSQKTKLANSGISFVWTRDDLNRMQITNLKQILNSIYPFGYDENRYGLADPFTYHTNQPSMSATIRLYIDNQEITTGLYGSGLLLMGNANIDWVDHVEIYTQNPTYEYATESTITLIKLYSKSVVKDEGSKIKVASGSYGKNYVDAYHAGWVKDWSYFVFGYKGNDKRKKSYSHQTTLSRDKQENTVIATLHKGKTNILLNAFTQDRNGFADASLDATPEKSKIKTAYFHLGIDSEINNFSYILTYSYSKIKSDMLDNVTPIPTAPYYGLFPAKSIQSNTHDIVLTGEVKYKKRIKNDRLLFGVKYRTKRATWDKSLINGVDMVLNRNKNIQNIASLYAENQYLFTASSLLTLGVEYQRVENKGTPQNDNLWMYRLSHTLIKKDWTFKTLYAHTLVPLEPYLVESHTFLSDPLHHHKLQIMDSFAENIIYKKDDNKYELILDYLNSKNYYLPDSNGKITNYNKVLKMAGIDARWIRKYNENDKLFISESYREIQNAPTSSGDFKEYTSILRNINTYQKFDIFNELIYMRNNTSQKNFYNYSLGLQYHYTNDIVVGLKGINIFDDAPQSSYYRVNPTTFKQEEPLRISPIDREFLLNVSWVF